MSTQQLLENAVTTMFKDQALIDELAEALRAFVGYGCPVCGGDCASANPPIALCPMQQAHDALAKAKRTAGPI